ncbi:methionine--tRNA ligase subunit beta [Candidatus Woesearchaeota archaeon]|nr:methionine--tRNA ligase subunit beta [Candidatus Woesearchaeota archaeon]
MPDTISYEDFAKLDIRIGTIKQALPHPNADKLIILKIDEGKDELRQLVAGIKESYKPEEIIGKQIVFLANLEPKELRGEISNGMILAADDNNKPVLLIPEKEVPNGSIVK